MAKPEAAAGTPGPGSVPTRQKRTSTQLHPIMITLALLLPTAAVGYSLLYLLFGGGFVGAVIIFIVAKMLGR